MNGFKNVAPVTLAGNGQVLNFDPEHANQFEFGTKLNLLADRLSATLSYYDIKVSNTVLQLSPTEYTQGGEQYSKGFEASLLASPVQGLNLIVGYSYNDSKLTKGNGSAFEGYRPESAGPKNLANLWISYIFSNLALNGFGLGFGGNYAGENMIYNRSNGTFTLPSYTIFNSSVFYDAKDFRLGLKLDNIANKAYYKGWSTISPQGLRTLSANFTYNF
jgi:iron complex outermembrane receptor protein